MYGLEPGIYGCEDDLVFDLDWKLARRRTIRRQTREEFDANEDYDGAILLEDDDDYERQEDGGLTGISKPIEGIFERLIFRKVESNKNFVTYLAEHFEIIFSFGSKKRMGIRPPSLSHFIDPLLTQKKLVSNTITRAARASLIFSSP